MIPLPVKTIIYDLDGTLIDSVQVVSTILNTMRINLGLPAMRRQDFIPWLSIGGEDLVLNALEKIDARSAPQYLREFRDYYLQLPTPHDSVFVGVRETLPVLRDMGYQLAICTNKPRNLVNKILSETKLEHLFEFINAEGDLPFKKPHPRTIESCLSHFSSKAEEAILVGDSTIDQQLAASSSVPFIFFSHGYDDGVMKEKTTFTLNKHVDLIDFLINSKQ